MLLVLLSCVSLGKNIADGANGVNDVYGAFYLASSLFVATYVRPVPKSRVGNRDGLNLFFVVGVVVESGAVRGAAAARHPVVWFAGGVLADGDGVRRLHLRPPLRRRAQLRRGAVRLRLDHDPLPVAGPDAAAQLLRRSRSVLPPRLRRRRRPLPFSSLIFFLLLVSAVYVVSHPCVTNFD